MNPLPESTPAFDILGPVLVPMPLWQVIALWTAAIALLGLAAWLIVRWRKSRPALPPPTPREIALKALDEARVQAASMKPYKFSFLISDILRRYLGGQFGLHAERQTSPEFLASVADSPRFSPREKELLADFLERCDLIKFARLDATAADNVRLLDQAVQFVNHAAEAPTLATHAESV